MYRMIIVDDLPIIVESLKRLFMEQRQVELELHTAHSAMEALRIMQQHFIDIVLTDIRMPEMEGIALLHEVRKLQPLCKVIFLTSYDDFSYAKRALSGGGFEYLLKTESNEVIVQTVKLAAEALDKDYEIKRKLYEADRKHSQLMPVIMQGYMRELLHGEGDASQQRRSLLFREWNMPLHAQEPVMMLVGRMDAWEKWREEERKLMAYAVQNVGDECVAAAYVSISVPYDESKVIWIMQSAKQQAMEAAGLQLVMENIQASCRSLLNVTLTLAVLPQPIQWEQLAAGFEWLRSLLLSPKGAGSGLLLDGQTDMEGNAAGVERSTAGSPPDHSNKIAMLRHYLELGQQEAFEELFGRLMAPAHSEPVSGFYKLELYHTLASLFLSYLNIHPLQEDWPSGVNLDKLFRIDPELSLDDMKHYFSAMAAAIFAHRTAPQIQYDHEVVNWIHDYIEAHLNEDLSVNRIAELVQLNPSYLSRIYKRATGSGLSDSIQQRRIVKAKELLKQTNMKIYEIAGLVGYDSRLSFIRLFKNLVQMTPQEYRDSH